VAVVWISDKGQAQAKTQSKILQKRELDETNI
jgi:hypothetical protein